MYGYKKAMTLYGPAVVKILVPSGTAKVVIDSRKMRMRCDRCTVVGIYDLDGNPVERTWAWSFYDESFEYQVGEELTVPDFSEAKTDHAPGIHYFIEFSRAAKFNVWLAMLGWPLMKLKWKLHTIFCK